MPLRKAHLTLPAGPADADADADSDAATAAARCLYRECTHVRVRTHRREVGYKTLSVRYSIYPCRLARLMDETPVECLKFSSVLIYRYQKEESVLRMSLEIRIYLTARHERTRLLSNHVIRSIIKIIRLVPGVRRQPLEFSRIEKRAGARWLMNRSETARMSFSDT